MQNVILVIHLILAVGLIGVVLMQRSEGGGLGIGGGGGGAVSGRSAANAMTKLTWILAVGFLCTSITLAVMSAQNNSSTSVIDSVIPALDSDEPLIPSLGGDSLLPPTTGDAPLAPPKAE